MKNIEDLKRSRLRKILKSCLDHIDNKEFDHIDVDTDYVKLKVKFDDEQPKIMTAEEIVNNYSDSVLNNNIEKDIVMVEKAIEETHKRYKPHIDRLEKILLNDAYTELFKATLRESLNLIIKEP